MQEIIYIVFYIIKYEVYKTSRKRKGTQILRSTENFAFKTMSVA